MWNTNMQWGGGFGWMIPLALWSGIWTGLSLWYAAKRNEKWWFILFLIVHTAGILEIVYLLFVAHAFDSENASAPRRKQKK